MAKRIYLYITPFFPSPQNWVGGYCLDAAKALIHDGRYDVRVITTGNGDDYEWDGVKVYRMHRFAAPFGMAPFIFDWYNNHCFKEKLFAMGIALSDVVICHVNTLTCAHYAAYFRGLNPQTKTVVQLHSSYGLNLSSGRLGVIPFHATLLYLYYRRIVGKVNLLVFVSEMSKRTFGRRYIGTPEGAIRDVQNQLWIGRILPSLRLPAQTVVYNGIDTALFYPKQKTPHEGFVIGCVANFQPLKDHMTLLRAVNLLKKRIPGLKARLIGSGETLVKCKEYVRQNGLDDVVSFEHEIDHRELPDLYRSLDLFVLPSRLEGFVCVCVESWACGTPTIFCENISLSELLTESERGKWIFKALDVKDLAERIYSYYQNRWEQHFTNDLEIRRLWKDFLDEIGRMRTDT